MSRGVVAGLPPVVTEDGQPLNKVILSISAFRSLIDAYNFLRKLREHGLRLQYFLEIDDLAPLHSGLWVETNLFGVPILKIQSTYRIPDVVNVFGRKWERISESLIDVSPSVKISNIVHRSVYVPTSRLFYPANPVPGITNFSGLTSEDYKRLFIDAYGLNYPVVVDTEVQSVTHFNVPPGRKFITLGYHTLNQVSPYWLWDSILIARHVSPFPDMEYYRYLANAIFEAVKNNNLPVVQMAFQYQGPDVMDFSRTPFDIEGQKHEIKISEDLVVGIFSGMQRILHPFPLFLRTTEGLWGLLYTATKYTIPSAASQPGPPNAFFAIGIFIGEVQ